MKRFLITTLLSSSLLLPCSAVAQQQASIPPTLLQRIRQLLGLVQPVAAGGSRGSNKQLCLLSPYVTSPQQGAITPTATPTIRVLQPLNEVRIDKDGRTIWRKVASSSQAINGHMAWPLPPLKPGEQVELVLRPRGASGGDQARVRLQAASADVLAQTRELLDNLSSHPEGWGSAVVDALRNNNNALAMVLLHARNNGASSGETSNGDATLEHLIQATACQGTP